MTDDEKQQQNFTELKSVLDDSSDKNRNLLIAFLVLQVYVFSATFSVTDFSQLQELNLKENNQLTQLKNLVYLCLYSTNITALPKELAALNNMVKFGKYMPRLRHIKLICRHTTNINKFTFM